MNRQINFVSNNRTAQFSRFKLLLVSKLILKNDEKTTYKNFEIFRSEFWNQPYLGVSLVDLKFHCWHYEINAFFLREIIRFLSETEKVEIFKEEEVFRRV